MHIVLCSGVLKTYENLPHIAPQELILGKFFEDENLAKKIIETSLYTLWDLWLVKFFKEFVKLCWDLLGSSIRSIFQSVIQIDSDRTNRKDYFKDCKDKKLWKIYLIYSHCR